MMHREVRGARRNQFGSAALDRWNRRGVRRSISPSRPRNPTVCGRHVLSRDFTGQNKLTGAERFMFHAIKLIARVLSGDIDLYKFNRGAVWAVFIS